MRRTVRNLAYVMVVTLALPGTGCVTQHRSAVCDVNPFAWSETAEIRYANTDTLAEVGMDLFLRCNEQLTEDTLTVRIATITPDSLRFEEALLLQIPRTRNVAALTREVVIPYRRRVLLARTGDYRIRVTPARAIDGIEAVGIHLTDNN